MMPDPFSVIGCVVLMRHHPDALLCKLCAEERYRHLQDARAKKHAVAVKKANTVSIIGAGVNIIGSSSNKIQ
jgi:hypothetical protein